MPGMGTIINTLAIVAGGFFGALFGRFLHDSAQNTLTKVCGVSTLFIAVTGALEQMLRVENGAIVTDRSMQTNLPGIFAAGDCTGTPYQLPKAVGEGNIAAHSVIAYLGEK